MPGYAPVLAALDRFWQNNGSIPTYFFGIKNNFIKFQVEKTHTCFSYDHGVYTYVVYIWKWSSAHALGGVSGVALFITNDEQLQ